MVFRYLTTIAAKSKVKIKARIANVGNSGTVGVDEADTAVVGVDEVDDRFVKFVSVDVGEGVGLVFG